MRFVLTKLGNIWWKLFGGIIFAAIWGVIGIALSFTVIGYPAAITCFKISYTVFKPFGKTVSVFPERFVIFNILWSLTFGFLLCSLAIAAYLINIFTLAGLPLLPQWFKVAKLSLFPFGCKISK